jgi:ribosomal protein S18 acetylase RimI-like enzyme
MSAKDANMLAVPSARVIANGVDLERFQPAPEKPGRRLLFVGSFRHFPNVSAFQWFWSQVWPLLHGCQLTVVAGPDPLLYWRDYTGERGLPAGDGLDLRGFVADVKPLYDDCNVAVIPTLVSAGTNLKVLEAMAMRRAVVSTPSGIAGIGLRDSEDVLVAETPEAFAGAIERLLADDSLRGRIAAHASELAHARYSWKSLGKLQGELWHALSPAPLRITSEPSPARTFAGYPAYVARWNGDIVAHLTWRETAPGERELLLMETAPPHRRQGIAARLLEEALTAAPGRWFLEVRVSNDGGRELYRRAGFQETGRRKNYYSDPTEDALLMEWSR